MIGPKGAGKSTLLALLAGATTARSLAAAEVLHLCEREYSGLSISWR